ncbi:MAG: NUDIX hydrolase [Balneolales bacterium]
MPKNQSNYSIINQPSPGIEYDQKSLTILAGGGVLFRLINGEPEVLLIHRKNLWDLPKGKLDSGESIAHCAIREVAEETGSALPMVVRELTSTYHQYQENKFIINKTTHWYLMITLSDSFTPQIEEDIDEIRWVPLGEAEKKVGYNNLRKVLQEVKSTFRSE